MNWLSRLTGALASAMVLVAFALPAHAAKTISLSVTPATLLPTTTVVTAKITNTGNSNANSFEIDWKTTTGFTVTGASAGGSPGSCTPPGTTPATAGSAYSMCRFLKQLPTKTSVDVTLNVQITNQCESLSIDWLAFAWTGSPGPASQSFSLDPIKAGENRVTSSSPNCEIKFVTQPTDAFVGSVITGSALNPGGDPVSVQLLRYGASVSGATVSLNASPDGCATPDSISNPTVGGEAEFVFAAGAPGSCVLTASSTGYTSVPSQPFTIIEPTGGPLDCGQSTDSVGDGADLPIGQCTRLGNIPSTGGPGAEECSAVKYNLTASRGTGDQQGISLVHELGGGQDATQFRFICTAYWLGETLPFSGEDGQPSELPKSKQAFGPDNTPANRDLDYCPGSMVTTDPAPCDSESPDTCKVVDFDLTGIPASMQDMVPPDGDDDPVPGDQKGCLLDERVQQCNAAGDPAVCLKQTWGWEGDAIIQRR